MQYLVFCMTNYGDGFYIGGVYRSEGEANKRLEWCEKHTIDPENDSWRILEVEDYAITASFER